MPFSSLLQLAPGIRLTWEVEGSCRLIRSSGAASKEETSGLKPRKPWREPRVCPLALMLLVNCHKQETQHLWRLSSLEGIWEINSHCWGRRGRLGGESPKLAAAAMTVTEGLWLALDQDSQGC